MSELHTLLAENFLTNDRKQKILSGYFEQIEMLLEPVMLKHQHIILWGYGKCGKWFYDILVRLGLENLVSYIIDDKIKIVYKTKPYIYRSSLLYSVDLKDNSIFFSGKDDREARETYCAITGGQKNFINIYERLDFGLLGFLEKHYGVEFNTNMDVSAEDHRPYQPSNHASFFDIVSIIESLNEPLHFFDFGCGKGAGILMGYLCNNVSQVGGVEYEKDVYDILTGNLEKLGISGDCICGDAAQLTDIDDYNCFYFYNPFGGDLFTRVMKNIEKSISRAPRRVWILYGNPFEHPSVVKDHVFKLVRQERVDFFDPELNIYCNCFL